MHWTGMVAGLRAAAVRLCMTSKVHVSHIKWLHVLLQLRIDISYGGAGASWHNWPCHTAHHCLQRVPQRNPGAYSLDHCLAFQACLASHCLFLGPRTAQAVWWGACSVLASRLALAVSYQSHHPQPLGRIFCDMNLPQHACCADYATEVMHMTPDGRTAAQIAACPDQALLVLHPLLRLFSCLPRCSQN